MDKFDQVWQNYKAVLALFGRLAGPARRKYRAFVAKGIDQGRRDDLVGGGLVHRGATMAKENAYELIERKFHKSTQLLEQAVAI